MMQLNHMCLIAQMVGLLITITPVIGYDGADTGQGLNPPREQNRQVTGPVYQPWSVQTAVKDPIQSSGGVPESWLTRVDQDIERQSRLVDWMLTWGFGTIIVLVGLCGVSIAYLWVRFSQMLATFDVSSDEQLADGTGVDLGKLGADGTPVERPDLYTQTVAGSLRRNPIPRVQFLSGVIESLVAGINASRRRRGEVETGYALVGKIIGEGSSRTLIVSGLIDEGPGATRTCGHIKFDRPYQQDELCLLQLVDTNLMHIGDAHLHPGSMDRCSSGDHQTDTCNVRDSHSQEMVFVIVTKAPLYGSGRSGESLYHAGLKLDFFYLGKASNYEYSRFRPQVVRGEMTTVPDELRKFSDSDPVRTRLDLDNLRRLTTYRMAIRMLATEGQRSRPCIEMAHRTRGFKTFITFSVNPSQRPEVFVDTGSQVMQFQPDWLNGRWLPGLVWFTPIVLSVEREMTDRHGAGVGDDFETSTDVRSTHVEAETPGPNTGERYGKLPTIEPGTSRGNPQGNDALSIRQ